MQAEKNNLADVFIEIAQSTALETLPAASLEMCMILVQPPQERTARDMLRRHGIGVWWPNYPLEIIKKDPLTGKRFQRIIRSSVLPGVILSPSSGSAHFWDMLDLAPGVFGVAQKPNGHWLMLSDLDIVLIHKIEHGLNRPANVRTESKYKTGDKVTLADDIYRRFPPGIVQKCLRNGIIKVELNFMGCLRVIDVVPHQIELA